MKAYFKKLWRGEIGLAKTFWIWSVLFGWFGFFLIGIVLTVVISGIPAPEMTTTEQGETGPNYYIYPKFYMPLFAIELAYNVAIYGCMYSAFLKSESLWRYGAILWVGFGLNRYVDSLQLLFNS